MSDEYISSQDAAYLAGVSQRTIERKLRKNEIEWTMSGNARKIKKSSLALVYPKIRTSDKCRKNDVGHSENDLKPLTNLLLDLQRKLSESQRALVAGVEERARYEVKLSEQEKEFQKKIYDQSRKLAFRGYLLISSFVIVFLMGVVLLFLVIR